MDDVLKAASEFHSRMPFAKEDQAKEEADRLFSKNSDQQAFLRAWLKMSEFDASVRASEFNASVKRIFGDD